MAPIAEIVEALRIMKLEKRSPVPSSRTEAPSRSSLTLEGGFLEAWVQGFNVGSLIILILIVFCNYRSGIWLHKLILLELVLALWHGTFIFVDDPDYGWYLSATATLLFISYQLHNVVSWLKIRPFLPPWGSKVFIFSLLAVQPFWVVEAWSNFEYFNNLGSDVNERLRAWEALLRDPWWIFTTWKLIDAIKKTYGFKLVELIKINSRFAVMLACMFVSIAFLLTDVIITALKISQDSGINPYWRFALVFKCASDTIFLDDFKSVLDEIIQRSFSGTRAGSAVHRGSQAPQGPRKASVRDGSEFIECGPMTDTNITSPPHQATHSFPRNLNPFAHRDRDRRTSLGLPKIHVQQETAVTSELRSMSRTRDSFGSGKHMIARPEPAISMQGSQGLDDGDSKRSLSTGRTGSDYRDFS